MGVPALASPDECARAERASLLIASLAHSLKAWDDAFLAVEGDMKRDGEKITESRIAVGQRNELRQQGIELPEVIRWRLRTFLGGVEGHE